MNLANETLEFALSSRTPIASLSTTISPTEPRFSFYRYTHTHAGSTESPILFIYTCPASSKIKERMIYAASSRSAVQMAETEAGLKIDKKIEASDPGDVTEESVQGDLHPRVEVKKAFERPKRPGRK